MHHDDPESIEWLEPAEVEGYYESVEMDGVKYSVSFDLLLHQSKVSTCIDWRRGNGDAWQRY